MDRKFSYWESVNDNTHAFYYIPCKKSVSGAHMRINDVKEHCKGTIHKENVEAIKMTRKISFSSSSNDNSHFKLRYYDQK